MLAFLAKLLLIVRSRLRSQAKLQAENLVLRQQVLVLTRKRASRVRLRNLDRLVLVLSLPKIPKVLETSGDFARRSILSPACSHSFLPCSPGWQVGFAGARNWNLS
jgi:hypothetical protein